MANNPTLSRTDCAALDAQDALAPLRDEFALPQGVIYLDGNSLGARPKASLATAQRVIQSEWEIDLIRSWNTAGWFEMPQTLGNQLAPLIGAGPGEVVVTDTISLNVFKALAALLKLQTDKGRKVILSEKQNFPTDLYMAQGLINLLGDDYELVLVDSPNAISAALNKNVAVVMLSHVNYHTGLMHDMAALTQAASAAGALTLWDLAHSAGAVPLDLSVCGVDAAVGCTYKYLNGGPGAPAFIWLNPKHLQGDVTFLQPLSGWWGHSAPFAMQPHYAPAAGIKQFLCGTQGIVSMAMVQDGLDVFAKTSMTALRQKSLALTDLFIALVNQKADALGLNLVTPRDHAQRGSQVCYAYENAFPVMQALIARGIIGDFRAPDILRFGFTPLYVRFIDVYDAAHVLIEILETGEWRKPSYSKKGLVT